MSLWQNLHTARADDRQMHDQSVFEMYLRIEPVALVWAAGRRLRCAEFQHAGKLLKALHRLGRQRINLRGVFCRQGVLCPGSLRALNAYLQHSYGRQSLGSVRCRLHRFEWANVQRAVGLRWVR